MSTPASPLLDFVTRLQDDSELQEQFAADPTGTMTAAGLSAEEQEIVQSRDLKRLTDAIGVFNVSTAVASGVCLRRRALVE